MPLNILFLYLFFVLCQMFLAASCQSPKPSDTELVQDSMKQILIKGQTNIKRQLDDLDSKNIVDDRYILLLEGLYPSYEAEGQTEKALSTLKKARELCKTRLAQDNPLQVNTSLSLATFYVNHNENLEEARQIYEDVLNQLRSTFADDIAKPTNESSALQGLGLLCMKERKFKEAEKFLKQSIEVDTKIHGSSSVISLINLAEVYAQENRIKGAEAIYKQAIYEENTSSGYVSPNLYESYAKLLNSLGRKDEAADVSKKAAVLRSSQQRTFLTSVGVGRAHDQSVMTARESKSDANLTSRNQVILLDRQAQEAMINHNYDQAKKLYLRSLVLENQVHDETPVTFSYTCRSLAAICMLQNNLSEAETLYKRQIDLLKDPGTIYVSEYWEIINDLAYCLDKEQKIKEADELYKNTLNRLADIKPNAAGLEDTMQRETALTLLNYVQFLKEQNQQAAAEPHLRQATSLLNQPRRLDFVFYWKRQAYFQRMRMGNPIAAGRYDNLSQLGRSLQNNGR